MNAPTRLALAASVACLMTTAPGRAQDAIPTQSPQPDLVKLLPPDVAAAKTFTLAVALGSPPDDFRDAKGEVAGWEIDIMRAATEALGLTLDIRPTTFDTLIPGLQSKRFDGATGQMGITDAREKVIDQVGTLVANEAFGALADSTVQGGRPRGFVRAHGRHDARLAGDRVRRRPEPEMRGGGQEADQRARLQRRQRRGRGADEPPGGPVLAGLHRRRVFRRPIQGPRQDRRAPTPTPATWA